MADLDSLAATLAARFGTAPALPADPAERAALRHAQEHHSAVAGRRSHRAFEARPVSIDLLRLLSAVALSAPSKSDMQQRDIVIVADPEIRQQLLAIVSDQAWTHEADALLVFCGNNRRQRQIHDLRGHAFANDHLDAFFNAAVDAGIALQAFIAAAEATGLGCCPISGLRNDAARVCDLLQLPEHVFPVAGLAVGWPATAGSLSPRLGLETTVHVDHFDDAEIANAIATYDARRHAQKPFRSQRDPDRFGVLPGDQYVWSEDKARQYAMPERQGFGAFVKARGFKLD